MTDASPLVQAQQKFADAVPFRSLKSEEIPLDQALDRVLAVDLKAPGDSPPYPRAIVEGFLVSCADTAGASDSSPLSFKVSGSVQPGDERCPIPKKGEGIQVATGSIVPAGDYAIVRMWDAEVGQGTFTIKRPFSPQFFIEAQGCDVKAGSVVVAAGQRLTPALIGTIASLGVSQVNVVRAPRVSLFASGDEVIPFQQALKPGQIRDCNTPMLATAVRQLGGVPTARGIMRDDFDAFVQAVKTALSQDDMVVISGGTAVGGRDFISDLLRAVGELVVDGVPMRSGRPLIMGVVQGKPLVCVAGHPPEALRGFRLFGAAAFNRLLGVDAPLPVDEPKP